MKIYANSGFNVCMHLEKIAADDSDIVIAAAAFYYFEDFEDESEAKKLRIQNLRRRRYFGFIT
jgi:heme oxygenase